MVNLNLKCTNRVGCLTATQNHKVRYYLNYTSNNQGRGGKILGGVQVICNMPSAVHRSRRAGVLTYFAGAGAGVYSPPVKL